MNSNDNIIIETKYGKIQGACQEDIYMFKGIPYAAPPIDKFRWMPPQQLSSWEGIRQTQAYSPISPQIIGPPGLVQLSRIEETQSEDCLYLNIWSPGLDGQKQPVMVWIHGGAFKIGSGSTSMYSGTNLTKRGNVVVVSINYRLGPLGFLRLKEVTGGRIPATGNEGLLDQIAALQWVQDNISLFGGDPDNVTVFGESAGAMSIGCLLAMPKARGLFHKAILQSGSNTVKSVDEAVQVAKQILDIIGISVDDTDAVKALSAEQLLNAHQELGDRLNIKGSVLEPVVDGDLLPAMPIDAVKNRSAENVVIIVGTNLEEARFMAMADKSLTKVVDAELIRRWQQKIPADLAPGLIDDYRKTMSNQGRDGSAPEIALALQTALQFRVPAIRLVEAQSRNNLPAYSYLFTWKSPAPNMGACHTLEIGFVFGNLIAGFNGSGTAAEKLMGQVQDSWLAFARTGNPSCESLGDWPQYGTRRVTMILGEDCHPEEAPYDEERRAWDSVPNDYLG